MGIAINYHYINEKEDGYWKGIKRTETRQFKKELSFLEEKYEIIDPADLTDFFYNNKDLPENFCVLTFDDGLKDHFINIFPLLLEHGIKACFAVPAVLFDKKKVLSAHKNHILLAELPAEDLVAEINSFFEKYPAEISKKHKIENKEIKDAIEPKLLRLKYRRDPVLVANLKYVLAVMPTEMKDNLLEKIFMKYFFSEEKIYNEFYLSGEEVKKMKDAGMVFAGHGYGHANFSTIPEEEQEKEIRTSKEIFMREFDIKLEHFSYPYGGFGDKTIKLLKDNGFRCAYTVNAGEIKKEDGPFKIKRWSAVDFFKAIKL